MSCLLSVRRADQPRQHRIQPAEGEVSALLYGRKDRVALLGRVERRGLCEASALAKLLELERLAPGHAAHPAVLVGLHDPERRFDLEVLALKDELAAVGHVTAEEPPLAADPNVHLLDFGATAPPLCDERWICERAPDNVTWGVEETFEPDLALARGGDRDALGLLFDCHSWLPFLLSSRSAIRSSRCSTACRYSLIHCSSSWRRSPSSSHSRTRPTLRVLTRPASSSSWTCFFTPVSVMPSGAASSLIDAPPRLKRSTICRRVGSASAASVLSTG